MMKNWFGNANVKALRELRNSEPARRLLARLDKDGSLTLDQSTLREIGADHQLAIRTICVLAMAERLHVRANMEGRIVVMSNCEFSRLVHQRAEITAGSERLAKREAAAPTEEIEARPVPEAVEATATMEELTEPAAALASDSAAVSAPAPGEEETVVLAPPSSDYAGDGLDWFTLEVAQAVSGAADKDGSAKKLPSVRQSLPDRPREPWMALDDARLEAK